MREEKLRIRLLDEKIHLLQELEKEIGIEGMKKVYRLLEIQEKLELLEEEIEVIE